MLAQGTARRNALDEATAEIEAGREDAFVPVEGALRAHARPGARAVREASAPRLRHRAAPPPDRRARGDAHGADRLESARRGAGERQRARRAGRAGRRGGGVRGAGRRGARASARRALARGGPRSSAALPIPPSDRLGQDDRCGRVRRGRAHDGRPHPHAPPAARLAVQPRARGGGLRRSADPRGRGGAGLSAGEPDHSADVRLVRAPSRQRQPRDVPARDRRRSPHCARREDQRSRSAASRTPSTSG